MLGKTKVGNISQKLFNHGMGIFSIQNTTSLLSFSFYSIDAPAVIEYTLHVNPLAKMEVLGLKTDLTAGSDPVPFGIAGYDDEENEFDTLDGLQISWYVIKLSAQEQSSRLLVQVVMRSNLGWEDMSKCLFSNQF